MKGNVLILTTEKGWKGDVDELQLMHSHVAKIKSALKYNRYISNQSFGFDGVDEGRTCNVDGNFCQNERGEKRDRNDIRLITWQHMPVQKWKGVNPNLGQEWIEERNCHKIQTKHCWESYLVSIDSRLVFEPRKHRTGNEYYPPNQKEVACMLYGLPCWIGGVEEDYITQDCASKHPQCNLAFQGEIERVGHFSFNLSWPSQCCTVWEAHSSIQHRQRWMQRRTKKQTMSIHTDGHAPKVQQAY